MPFNKNIFQKDNKFIVLATVVPLLVAACSLIAPSTPIATKKEIVKTVQPPVIKVGEKIESKTPITTNKEIIKTVQPPMVKVGEKIKSEELVKNSDLNQEDIIYSLDFSRNNKEDARKWLTEKGFHFKSDASYQSSLAVSFKNESLVLEAKEKLFGLIVNGSLNIKDAKKIKITWGVNKYPKGASYEKGINNEAIMLYVYFGQKKLSSGSMFIPNSPYFTGLYLGETDKLNKPFTGKHFKKGGRFICLGNPKLGETIISEFDINKGFKECFGKNAIVPFVSGIALEVETSRTGTSKSFIKKIDFIK